MAVAECAIAEKDGKTLRTLALQGGVTIVDELVGTRPSYTYRIIDSPPPVANYQSTHRRRGMPAAPPSSGPAVRRARSACDADAVGEIEGIYQGLDLLGVKPTP